MATPSSRSSFGLISERDIMQKVFQILYPKSLYEFSQSDEEIDAELVKTTVRDIRSQITKKSNLGSVQREFKHNIDAILHCDETETYARNDITTAGIPLAFQTVSFFASSGLDVNKTFDYEGSQYALVTCIARDERQRMSSQAQLPVDETLGRLFESKQKVFSLLWDMLLPGQPYPDGLNLTEVVSDEVKEKRYKKITALMTQNHENYKPQQRTGTSPTSALVVQDPYAGEANLEQLVTSATFLVALEELRNFFVSENFVLFFLGKTFQLFEIGGLKMPFTVENCCINTLELWKSALIAKLVVQGKQSDEINTESVNFPHADHKNAEVLRKMREARERMPGVQCTANAFLGNWEQVEDVEEVTSSSSSSSSSGSRFEIVKGDDASSFKVRSILRLKRNELFYNQYDEIISELNAKQEALHRKKVLRGGIGQPAMLYVLGDTPKRIEMITRRSGRKFLKYNFQNPPRVSQTFSEKTFKPTFSDLFDCVMLNEILDRKVHMPTEDDLRALNFSGIAQDILSNIPKQTLDYELEEMYQCIQNRNPFEELENPRQLALELCGKQNAIQIALKTCVDVTGILPHQLEDQFIPIPRLLDGDRESIKTQFENYLSGDRTIDDFKKMFLNAAVVFHKSARVQRLVLAGDTTKIIGNIQTIGIMNRIEKAFSGRNNDVAKNFYLTNYAISDLMPDVYSYETGSAVLLPGFSRTTELISLDKDGVAPKVALLAELKKVKEGNMQFITEVSDENDAFYIGRLAIFGGVFAKKFKVANNKDTLFCWDLFCAVSQPPPKKVSERVLTTGNKKKIRTVIQELRGIVIKNEIKAMTALYEETQRTFLNRRDLAVREQDKILMSHFIDWYNEEMQKIPLHSHEYINFMAKVVLLATAGYYEGTIFDHFISILFRQRKDNVYILGGQTLQFVEKSNKVSAFTGEYEETEKSFRVQCENKTNIESLTLQRLTSIDGKICFLDVPPELFEKNVEVKTDNLLLTLTQSYIDERCVYDLRASQSIYADGEKLDQESMNFSLLPLLQTKYDIANAFENQTQPSKLSCVGWKIGVNLHTVNFIGNQWFVCLSNPYGYTTNKKSTAFERFKNIANHEEKILELMEQIDPTKSREQLRRQFFLSEKLYKKTETWVTAKNNYVYSLKEFFSIINKFRKLKKPTFLKNVANAVFEKIDKSARKKLKNALKKPEPLGCEFVEHLSKIFAYDLPDSNNQIFKGGLWDAWVKTETGTKRSKREPLQFQTYVLLIFLVAEATHFGPPKKSTFWTKRSEYRVDQKVGGVLLSLRYKLSQYSDMQKIPKHFYDDISAGRTLNRKTLKSPTVSFYKKSPFDVGLNDELLLVPYEQTELREFRLVLRNLYVNIFFDLNSTDPEFTWGEDNYINILNDADLKIPSMKQAAKKHLHILRTMQKYINDGMNVRDALKTYLKNDDQEKNASQVNQEKNASQVNQDVLFNKLEQLHRELTTLVVKYTDATTSFGFLQAALNMRLVIEKMTQMFMHINDRTQDKITLEYLGELVLPETSGKLGEMKKRIQQQISNFEHLIKQKQANISTVNFTKRNKDASANAYNQKIARLNSVKSTNSRVRFAKAVRDGILKLINAISMRAKLGKSGYDVGFAHPLTKLLNVLDVTEENVSASIGSFFIYLDNLNDPGMKSKVFKMVEMNKSLLAKRDKFVLKIDLYKFVESIKVLFLTQTSTDQNPELQHFNEINMKNARANIEAFLDSLIALTNSQKNNVLQIINENHKLLQDLGVKVPPEIKNAIGMMEAYRVDLDFGSDAAGAAASPKRPQNEQGGTQKKRQRGSGATSRIATSMQLARNTSNQQDADKMELEFESEDEDVDMVVPKFVRTRSNSGGAAASAPKRITPTDAIDQILTDLRMNPTIKIKHTTGEGSLWYVQHEGKDVLVSNIYIRPGTYPRHELALNAFMNQVVMRVANANHELVFEVVEFCLKELISQRGKRHAFLLGTGDETCTICGGGRFDSIHKANQSDTIMYKVKKFIGRNYEEFQEGLRFN